MVLVPYKLIILAGCLVQIPLDVVIKLQPIDIPGLILQQILRPSVMYERDLKG